MPEEREYPPSDSEALDLERGHKLLDEDSIRRLPPLYSGEELGLHAVAQVRFFTPDANWSWYASEFDGEDIFFGLVIGHEIELGYWSLSELREVRGPGGRLVERDLDFEPASLRELKAWHEYWRNQG